MKKAYLFALFLCLGIHSSFAQTKLISHKSHSGSKANFKIALDKNLFDLGDSNFGVAPEPMIQTSRLDSLIFLPSEGVVMVTHKVCSRPLEDTSIWQAGKDTVYNHPLFNQQHSLAHIQKTLDQDYYFTNKSKTVAFIGFDDHSTEKSQATKPEVAKEKKKEKAKKKRPKKKKEAKPKKEKKKQEILEPSTTDPIDYSKSSVSFLSLAWVALFSLLMAWTITKFQKP